MLPLLDVLIAHSLAHSRFGSYYKLNRSVILTTSHVPRRLSVRGERLYFPYVMPLLVAVIAIVYCFIWPYVQAYLYTTLTGSKMAGTKLR
jgi:hypothetical protein